MGTFFSKPEPQAARQLDDIVTATVQILKEDSLDLASDAISEMLGDKVKMWLVSLEIDPGTKTAKLSSEFSLRFGGGTDDEKDAYIKVPICLAKDFGKPGAILMESHYSNEFFLKSITLEMPDATKIYFSCHSWIVKSELNFDRPRIFFHNQVYLPKETPAALVGFRQDDLVSLRGDGKSQRKYGERIYDYDVYNDLGYPDQDEQLQRPVLGGSADRPYPRRCRTGGERSKKDPASEVPSSGFGTYVPRDNRFNPQKKALFIAAGVRSFGHDIAKSLENLLDEGRPFSLVDEIHSLYVGELRDNNVGSATILRNPHDGTVMNFPPPGVVQVNKDAWKSDQEFARQRLAGLNPLVIERLKVFPPVSSLDPEKHGSPTSSITTEHLKKYLEGLTVEEALDQKRLYILDYHDLLMPYINKVNELAAKAYASRTIFYLTKAGILLPVAIELSLPPKEKGEEAINRVFTPVSEQGQSWWLWQLAKTHVAIIDFGYHELVSHWLRSHTSVEPFIIATRRQLSAMHPVHVLLSPHFKDTMHINAFARTGLINAGGKIEAHFSPGKYCMEISSEAYKSWRYDEQALPKDLLKRGMAEEDPSAKHGLRLSIEDYPFAADGLDLWAAIKQWVKEYVEIYYDKDEVVQEDGELQEWWEEVKSKGHGDHAGAEWWVAMKSVEELKEVLTTLIWIASALHAAVNFGQYAYAGFMPNLPALGRRLLPHQGTPEHDRLLVDPEKFFLATVPTQSQTTFTMSVVEILAQHMEEEEYLGQRSDPQWTVDPRVLQAFSNFRSNLVAVEAAIEARNDPSARLPHRAGPAQLPYTLLAPSSSTGLTFRGVPNSISI